MFRNSRLSPSKTNFSSRPLYSSRNSSRSRLALSCASSFAVCKAFARRCTCARRRSRSAFASAVSRIARSTRVRNSADSARAFATRATSSASGVRRCAERQRSKSASTATQRFSAFSVSSRCFFKSFSMASAFLFSASMRWRASSRKRFSSIWSSATLACLSLFNAASASVRARSRASTSLKDARSFASKRAYSARCAASSPLSASRAFSASASSFAIFAFSRSRSRDAQARSSSARHASHLDAASATKAPQAEHLESSACRSLEATPSPQLASL
mmetsp:Transcript_8184/g.26874  ORF Transcript_8184/g.26874 Transcript_8184/m.26874 type:complete len:275 (-) Transcript_8184:1763-2587(-)